MAPSTCVTLLSSSLFRIKLLENPLSHPCKSISPCCYHMASQKGSTKAMMAQYPEPERLKAPLQVVTGRLEQAVPEPVKQFPWKKAETMLLDRVINLGQKALKWSLIMLFVVSSLSDAMFAILRNKELMIPIGLFAGCLLADFLKEVGVEFLGDSEDKGLTQAVTVISCFFVLLKLMTSACSGLGVRVFLFHVSNGGLMQALWLWRSLLNETGYERSRTLQ